MSRTNGNSHLWSIILAGGEGERIRPFIQAWLGRHVPKQYCSFVGTRSMLHHTLDRADGITCSEHHIIVTAASHEREGWLRLLDRPHGPVIRQPANRDTAAGVYLPLTYIKSCDPGATVVIYPSDHFVYPKDRFVDTVRQSIQAAESLGDRLVLLGVTPDRLELDYGWILPGPVMSCPGQNCVRAVAGFVEKPGPVEARAVMEAGGLWNTLILAARVEVLWKLGWRCFPSMMPLFETIEDAIGTAYEAEAIETAYGAMPARSFSSGLLAKATDQAALIELSGVIWSDWGRPERIVDTLRRCGIRAAFPPECMIAWQTGLGNPIQNARTVSDDTERPQAAASA